MAKILPGETDIYAITDAGLSLGRPLEEVASALLGAGVRILQYREKKLKAGAMLRQGAHHGAQKSTSTGSSLRPTWRSKLPASSSSGRPTNSGWWQRPQLGLAARRSRGTRFTAAQCGQTRCSESSDMGRLRWMTLRILGRRAPRQESCQQVAPSLRARARHSSSSLFDCSPLVGQPARCRAASSPSARIQSSRSLRQGMKWNSLPPRQTT